MQALTRAVPPSRKGSDEPLVRIARLRREPRARGLRGAAGRHRRGRSGRRAADALCAVRHRAQGGEAAAVAVRRRAAARGRVAGTEQRRARAAEGGQRSPPGEGRQAGDARRRRPAAGNRFRPFGPGGAAPAGRWRFSWVALPDGGYAARVEVSSPGAAALRLGLSTDATDPDVAVRFTGAATGAPVYGPYPGNALAEAARRDGAFWSPVSRGRRRRSRSTARPTFPPPRCSSRWRASRISRSPARSCAASRPRTSPTSAPPSRARSTSPA